MSTPGGVSGSAPDRPAEPSRAPSSGAATAREATASPPPEADGAHPRSAHAATCVWTIADFASASAGADAASAKRRQVWTESVRVGGYDVRLLLYPRGDSQALPGYVSAYLEVTAPADAKPRKGNWECFVAYELSARPRPETSRGDGAPPTQPSRNRVARDSWHRFSSRRKSHGWCDFAERAALLACTNGDDGALTIRADVAVLSESCALRRDDLPSDHRLHKTDASVDDARSASASPPMSGVFTWTVDNFNAFREMIKTQKIMSPSFPAGDCNFRLSVYQSRVRDSDRLSVCVESKEPDAGRDGARGGATGVPGAVASSASPNAASKTAGDADPGVMTHERNAWMLFRVSAVNELDAKRSTHRDSHGRFASDARGGNHTSLGWNDFMPMDVFAETTEESSLLGANTHREEDEGKSADGLASPSARGGFLLGADGRATFSVAFHVVREACEAKAHHQRVAGTGRATARLSEDGGVSGLGGGVPAPSLANRARLSALRKGGRANRGGVSGDRSGLGGSGTGSNEWAEDQIVARFTWRIDGFGKLKDLLKKRKMTGLCVKSRRFRAGGRDCRLIVYPRGQSQPPNHLSMFLEVTDPRAAAHAAANAAFEGKGFGYEGHPNRPPDWSCFVSHRLAVYNQADPERSAAKESQNRYGRAAKDWGWREFVTLTTLFDADGGFVVDDVVVFTAEVLVLKETTRTAPLADFRRLGLSRSNTDAEGGSGSERAAARFDPARLEAFIAEHGLDESEKKAALRLFGPKFLEVLKRALERKERGEKTRGGDGGDADGGESSSSAEKSSSGDVPTLAAPSPARMAYCKAASAWAPDGNEDEARTSSETKNNPHLAKLFADAEATDEAGDPARLPGEGVDVAFTWRVENFAAFRDVLETRKIFSEYFTAGAKRLRIGAYESYDTLCVYLESEKAPATAAKSGKKKDAPVPPPEKGKEKPPGFETDEPDAKKKKKDDEKGSSDPEETLGSDPDRNYWVRYRVAVLNQKHPERTQWKEGAVCTKTWNTQVLQFKSVDDVLDPENGFAQKDAVAFACEILDVCPWFDVPSEEEALARNEALRASGALADAFDGALGAVVDGAVKRATASGEVADGDGAKQTPARPGDAAAVVAAAAGLAPGVESIDSLLPNGAGDLGVDAETVASTLSAYRRDVGDALAGLGAEMLAAGRSPVGGDKGFDKGFDKSDKTAGEKKEAGGNKTLSLDGITGSKRADGEGTVRERKRPRVKDALAELARLAPEGEEASQSESDHSSADACAKRAALGWPAEDPRHDPTNEVERVLRAQIASRVGATPGVDEDAADDAFARETEALRSGLSAESIATLGSTIRAFTRGREKAIGFMFETCRAEHPIDALARRTRADRRRETLARAAAREAAREKWRAGKNKNAAEGTTGDEHGGGKKPPPADADADRPPPSPSYTESDYTSEDDAEDPDAGVEDGARDAATSESFRELPEPTFAYETRVALSDDFPRQTYAPLDPPALARDAPIDGPRISPGRALRLVPSVELLAGVGAIRATLVECVLGTVAECLERLKASRSSDSSDSNQNRGPTDDSDSDSELAVIERSLEFATRYLAAVSRVAPDPEGAGEARELAVANALVAVLSADDEDGGFARWRARVASLAPALTRPEHRHLLVMPTLAYALDPTRGFALDDEACDPPPGFAGSVEVVRSASALFRRTEWSLRLIREDAHPHRAPAFAPTFFDALGALCRRNSGTSEELINPKVIDGRHRYLETPPTHPTCVWALAVLKLGLGRTRFAKSAAPVAAAAARALVVGTNFIDKQADIDASARAVRAGLAEVVEWTFVGRGDLDVASRDMCRAAEMAALEALKTWEFVAPGAPSGTLERAAWAPWSPGPASTPSRPAYPRLEHACDMRDNWEGSGQSERALRARERETFVRALVDAIGAAVDPKGTYLVRGENGGAGEEGGDAPSPKDDTPPADATSSAKKPSPPKTKAEKRQEKRQEKREAAEREADAREAAAVTAIMGGGGGAKTTPPPSLSENPTERHRRCEASVDVCILLAALRDDRVAERAAAVLEAGLRLGAFRADHVELAASLRVENLTPLGAFADKNGACPLRRLCASRWDRDDADEGRETSDSWAKVAGSVAGVLARLIGVMGDDAATMPTGKTLFVRGASLSLGPISGSPSDDPGRDVLDESEIDVIVSDRAMAVGDAFATALFRGPLVEVGTDEYAWEELWPDTTMMYFLYRLDAPPDPEGGGAPEAEEGVPSTAGLGASRRVARLVARAATRGAFRAALRLLSERKKSLDDARRAVRVLREFELLPAEAAAKAAKEALELERAARAKASAEAAETLSRLEASEADARRRLEKDSRWTEKIRDLERRLEWADGEASERERAMARAEAERAALERRAADLEADAKKLRDQRREDAKRVAKEKDALVAKAREAEQRLTREFQKEMEKREAKAKELKAEGDATRDRLEKAAAELEKARDELRREKAEKADRAADRASRHRGDVSNASAASLGRFHRVGSAGDFERGLFSGVADVGPIGGGLARGDGGGLGLGPIGRGPIGPPGGDVRSRGAAEALVSDGLVSDASVAPPPPPPGIPPGFFARSAPGTSGAEGALVGGVAPNPYARGAAERNRPERRRFDAIQGLAGLGNGMWSEEGAKWR